MQIGIDDADGRVVEDVAKALLALAQRRFGAAALGSLALQVGGARVYRRLDAARASGHCQQQRGQHRGRQQAHGGEQPGVAVAGVGHGTALRADAQQPALAAQLDRRIVPQRQCLGLLAANGSGQAGQLRLRLAVDQAPAQVGRRVAQAGFRRLLHAQGDEHHALERLAPVGGRRLAPVQRPVEHHTGLLPRLLGQHEAGGSRRRIGVDGTQDGLARRGDRQGVDAQRHAIAVHRLDHADGHDIGIACGHGRLARQAAIEHAVGLSTLLCDAGLEGGHFAARHALAEADGLQLDRQRQPGLRHPAQLVGRHVVRADHQATCRFEREAGLAQLRFERGGHCRGIALEHALAALQVPARDQHRGQRQQRGGGQQRQGQRDASRRPIGAWPADQGQGHRRADQHAQRVAHPPGPPGEGARRTGQGAGGDQPGRRQRGVEQAGQHRAQQEEGGHVARFGQRDRPGQAPAHQRGAQRRLQGRAHRREQRQQQHHRRQRAIGSAHLQVDQVRAQHHAGQHAAAVHQHGGQGQPGSGVDRRRVAWRYGQQLQRQLAQDVIGQRRQQRRHQPVPAGTGLVSR